MIAAYQESEVEGHDPAHILSLLVLVSAQDI